jgi:hypothetical protein
MIPYRRVNMAKGKLPKELREDYEERKKVRDEFLADKPPRIDTELMDHIFKVWEGFLERFIKKAPSEEEAYRLAAYATIAYFATGGKMPPEKFYLTEMLPSIDGPSKDK